MALDRSPVPAVHPRFDRRTAVQAGAIGLLGLGGGHLRALQAAGENASALPAFYPNLTYFDPKIVIRRQENAA